MLDKLAYYFSFPFARYAFAVGVLVALCAALLGVILVLKRYSMIGDGLSHVAFGAMAVSAVVGAGTSMAITLPITMLAAVLILRGRKLQGDAALAMLSVSALAIGYLLLHIFPGSGNVSGDVCTTLFGSASILTLSRGDVYMCIALCVLVIALFCIFYNRLFAVTFDAAFAKAAGVATELYELGIALVCAVVVVVAMKLVGALLISALIVFPTLCASALFRSFRAVMAGAAVISVVCAALGMVISLLCGTPVGATVVCADLAAFVVCTIIGKLK